MGKIYNALDKYARERRKSGLQKLSASDLEILLSYDRETGHLLKYDPKTGQMDARSLELFRNKGVIQRLLDNGLIYPGGKLTPKGFEECRTLTDSNPGIQAAKVSMPQQPDVSEASPAEVTPAEEKKMASTEPQVEERASAERFQAAPLIAETVATEVNEDVAEIVFTETPVAAPAVKAHPAATFSRSISSVSFDQKRLDRNLVVLLEPQSIEAEQFKTLRTNILYPISGTPPQSILVTSANPAEGKSFVAANLAVSIARHINRFVLLMDCDLRKPDIHRQFGFGGVAGLSDYLSGRKALDSLFLSTIVEKLTLLPAGPVPPNPSELMSSESMSELLNEVKSRYQDRLVVIDSPPPTMAAETPVLARQVDGIILVSRHGKTPREDLEQLISQMGTEKILGVVVNYIDKQASRYYRYSKYGKYGGRS